MIDLGEEIYEILSENGWEIVEWGERIGHGWFYEIEHLADNGEVVTETVKCLNDSRKAFVNGIENLCLEFDSEQLVADWINVNEPIDDLLYDAHRIQDSLDNLCLALEDIDFDDEKMM